MKGLEKIKSLCQELRIVVLIFGKLTLVKKKLAEKARLRIFSMNIATLFKIGLLQIDQIPFNLF
jgi:hypothetical protein